MLVKPRCPQQAAELIASLPPCTIGMEACSGAHHWARLFMAHGHICSPDGAQVRGALTGCRASKARTTQQTPQPSVRPCSDPTCVVPIKTVEQQGQLCIHRVRHVQRTATINRIRGLIPEFGIVLPPPAAATIRREAMAHLEDLPGGPTPSLEICSTK